MSYTRQRMSHVEETRMKSKLTVSSKQATLKMFKYQTVKWVLQFKLHCYSIWCTLVWTLTFLYWPTNLPLHTHTHTHTHTSFSLISQLRPKHKSKSLVAHFTQHPCWMWHNILIDLFQKTDEVSHKKNLRYMLPDKCKETRFLLWRLSSNYVWYLRTNGIVHGV